MFIKKLQFVARATLYNFKLIPELCVEDSQKNKETIAHAMRSAREVHYADDVI